MKTLSVLVMILVGPAAMFAQDPAVALYIQTITPGTEPGTMNLVLKSGAKLTVKITDIDTSKTTEAVRAANQPSARNATSVIREGCQKEWGTDFKMRQFCESQQRDALAKINQRPMSATSDLQAIRKQCLSEWPENFKMQDFCEEQQMKALRELTAQ